MTKFPMTAQGAKALEEELARLLAERPKISEAIATAREQQGLAEQIIVGGQSIVKALQSRFQIK